LLTRLGCGEPIAADLVERSEIVGHSRPHDQGSDCFVPVAQHMETHRLPPRVELHRTPKHAAASMGPRLGSAQCVQCIRRRIGERCTLIADIDAWTRQRNASGTWGR
jgi:hypothetical protein